MKKPNTLVELRVRQNEIVKRCAEIDRQLLIEEVDGIEEELRCELESLEHEWDEVCGMDWLIAGYYEVEMECLDCGAKNKSWGQGDSDPDSLAPYLEVYARCDYCDGKMKFLEVTIANGEATVDHFEDDDDGGVSEQIALDEMERGISLSENDFEEDSDFQRQFRGR